MSDFQRLNEQYLEREDELFDLIVRDGEDREILDKVREMRALNRRINEC